MRPALTREPSSAFFFGCAGSRPPTREGRERSASARRRHKGEKEVNGKRVGPRELMGRLGPSPPRCLRRRSKTALVSKEESAVDLTVLQCEGEDARRVYSDSSAEATP